MSSVSLANKRTFTQSISSAPQPDTVDPNKRTKFPETLPLFGSSSSTDALATSMDIDALKPADSNSQGPISHLFYPIVDASDRLKATESMLQAFNVNNEQGVKDALEAGADVDLTMAEGETPMMMAIERGWLDVAKSLLEKSLSVTINVSKQGQTALSLAFGKIKDIVFLTNLFERCRPETINQIDKDGRTALMNACRGGVDDVVFLTNLFECSTDETINQIDKNGITTLMIACDRGRENIGFLSKLLERSTDETINQIDKNGITALSIACYTEEDDILTDVVFLTKLFDRSTDKTINQIDEYCKTTLIVACRCVKDVVFLTKLLERCTDKTINQIVDWDKTALIIACDFRKDVVFLTKLLGRCRPETINQIDRDGLTVQMLACRHVKDIGFLETLLGQTSDSALNAVSESYGTQSVLTALLEDEANVDLAKHLVPLFLERLTWANFKIQVSVPASPNDGLTAWQIVNQRGAPWADTAKRIGEAMVMSCAQYAIPRSLLVEGFARNIKNLTTKFNKHETRANICDHVLHFENLLPKPIPQDILYIIRSYHENPFYDLSQAVSAINDFMTWHLTEQDKLPEDGSQALQGVPQVLEALHDSESTLKQCLAEYEASCRKAVP